MHAGAHLPASILKCCRLGSFLDKHPVQLCSSPWSGRPDTLEGWPIIQQATLSCVHSISMQRLHAHVWVLSALTAHMARSKSSFYQ